MRMRAVLPWILLSLPLMGAKDEGCATEVQPGDGSSEAWELGTLPQKSGVDLPMTCEWLEQDNCWKDLAAEAETCLVDARADNDSALGTFTDDRSECSFADGHRLELGGPISQPANNIKLLPVVDQRVVDHLGMPCHTAKILSVGRVAHVVHSGAVVLESTSLTDYRVICPDGRSYSNAVQGTCADFGLRWLAKKAPGYALTCDGQSDRCEAEFWGTSSGGAQPFFSCGG